MTICNFFDVALISGLRAINQLKQYVSAITVNSTAAYFAHYMRQAVNPFLDIY